MGRVLSVTIATLAVLGGLVALLALFSARDEPGVAAREAEGPGDLQPDRGASHADAAPPASKLPTSGTHRPVDVRRDGTDLTGDELLHALELGNVVLAYGTRRPPAALRTLQEDVAGPFDPELAAAGQSVILSRIDGLDGVAALAWRRILRADDPAFPALREFAEAWLGEGAAR